jgi:hypothetical protein
MAGTTGDIIWRRQDPKTWELYNIPPTEAPAVAEAQPEAEPAAEPQAEARQADQERAILQQMMQAHRPPSFEEAPPRTKRMWRRQIRDYFSEAEDPRSDPYQGIQSMIDSGAIRYDEDGLWVAQPNLGTKRAQQLIQAADAWADKVGLWRPREGGGAEFDPSNYQPYGSEQGRMQWSEMQKVQPESTEDLERLIMEMGGK